MGVKQASFQPPLLTRLLVVANGGMIRPQAEVGITVIVVGAILFALGFFPGLLPALMERFQGLLDYFLASRGRIQKFQSDLQLHTDVWLLGGGVLILIFGLLALLC